MRRTYLVLVHVQVPDLLELARLGGDAGAAPKGGPGEYRGVAQHGVAAQHVRAVPKPAACSTDYVLGERARFFSLQKAVSREASFCR